MIYLTQLIFVKDGQEAVFHEFEAMALPLLEKYNGSVIYRVRPAKENFVLAKADLPYEIHFLSFESEEDFKAFMKDDSRQAFLHLKEQSIRSSILIKGQRI